jgi:hypothetical protein
MSPIDQQLFQLLIDRIDHVGEQVKSLHLDLKKHMEEERIVAAKVEHHDAQLHLHTQLFVAIGTTLLAILSWLFTR